MIGTWSSHGQYGRGFFFKTKDRHASAKAQEAVDHMASFFYQVERRFHNMESPCQPLPFFGGVDLY